MFRTALIFAIFVVAAQAFVAPANQAAGELESSSRELEE
jgi:hypothetical protein